jgi:hypothetical protein
VTEIAVAITSIAAAIGVIYTIIRQILKWPETEAIVTYIEDGKAHCSLHVINEGKTHIHVVRVAILWPRSMRLGKERYADGPNPWTPGPLLPVDWSLSLPVSLVVEPGSKGTLEFVLSNFPIDSNTQSVLIEMRAARFIARRSWKPVKILHMATSMSMIA